MTQTSAASTSFRSSTLSEVEFRSLCERCWRPRSVCYCQKLVRLQTPTRVVFLQHPRERRVAVSTARMAHLSLENSEMHWGVSFAGDSRLESLCQQEGTYVLFPQGDCVAPETLQGNPPKNLIVVDGTWSLARKVLKQNPMLWKLPRIGLTPRRPSNYRIRKEPADNCVSTIEAVGEVLGALEGDWDRFDRMLVAFEFMVDTQLDFARNREGPLRYLRHKGPPRSRVPLEIRERFESCVAVYGETNAHAPGSGLEGRGELIQLVAERPATQERFSAFLTPRRPLGPNVPLHLELPAELLLEGEAPAEALEKFRKFLRPQDVLCSWGHFSLDLLREEGIPVEGALDLRRTLADVLKGPPGSMESAASRIAAPLALAWAPGRAGGRLGLMASLLQGLKLSAAAEKEFSAQKEQT